MNSVSNFLAVFLTVTVVSTGISVIGAKNGHKTHNEPYLPFLMIKIHGRSIIFDAFLMNELCVKLSGSFWTVTVVSTGISAIGAKNGHKNTYLTISTLPDN